MKPILGIACIAALAILLGMLQNTLKPVPHTAVQKPTLAAAQQKAATEQQQMERYMQHQRAHRADYLRRSTATSSKLKYRVRDDDGTIVGSDTDNTDDWFQYGRDGKAGLHVDPGVIAEHRRQ